MSMSIKLIKAPMMFYPVESYNNRQRAEQRWEDEARREGNPYCQTDGWQISIKNGKRLNRHWSRARGLYYVATQYGDKSIYNENYDADWLKAKRNSYDRSFQPDIEAGCYDRSGGYDSIPYHVGMDDDDY